MCFLCPTPSVLCPFGRQSGSLPGTSLPVSSPRKSSVESCRGKWRFPKLMEVEIKKKPLLVAFSVFNFSFTFFHYQKWVSGARQGKRSSRCLPGGSGSGYHWLALIHVSERNGKPECWTVWQEILHEPPRPHLLLLWEPICWSSIVSPRSLR